MRNTRCSRCGYSRPICTSLFHLEGLWGSLDGEKGGIGTCVKSLVGAGESTWGAGGLGGKISEQRSCGQSGLCRRWTGWR